MATSSKAQVVIEENVRSINKSLQKKYEKLIQKMEKEFKDIKDQVVTPCKWCVYEGMYRCEACAENFFEGFNIKNYPR